MLRCAAMLMPSFGCIVARFASADAFVAAVFGAAAAMTVLVLEMLGDPPSFRGIANLRTYTCDDGTISATVGYRYLL